MVAAAIKGNRDSSHEFDADYFLSNIIELDKIVCYKQQCIKLLQKLKSVVTQTEDTESVKKKKGK